MKGPHLIEVELQASDLDRSARFYRDVVGVPLEKSDPHPPRNVAHYETAWGEWGSEDRAFLFFAVYPAAAAATTRSGVGFAVESLDEVHRRALAAGAHVVEEPHETPWGRSAILQDPDGNLVSLIQS